MGMDGNGNTSRLNLGMGMNDWEWEGLGTKMLFRLTSTKDTTQCLHMKRLDPVTVYFAHCPRFRAI